MNEHPALRATPMWKSGRSLHEIPNMVRNRKELLLIHTPNDVADDGSQNPLHTANPHTCRLLDDKAHLREPEWSHQTVVQTAINQFQGDVRQCVAVTRAVVGFLKSHENGKRLCAEAFGMVEANEWSVRPRGRLYCVLSRLTHRLFGGLCGRYRHGYHNGVQDWCSRQGRALLYEGWAVGIMRVLV